MPVKRPDITIAMLKKLSDNLEIRFCCPVYLVGSLALGAPDPLDVDLVMVMSIDRMKRLFGGLEFNERRFRFYAKQKFYYETYMTDVDIDFKVQTPEEFAAANKYDHAIKLGTYVEKPLDYIDVKDL